MKDVTGQKDMLDALRDFVEDEAEERGISKRKVWKWLGDAFWNGSVREAIRGQLDYYAEDEVA